MLLRSDSVFLSFQGSNASSAVNDSIYLPLSVSGNGERPMAYWIFQNDEYTELYHQYFAEFPETVDINGITESALKQLSGETDSVDTSHITLSDMGTMSMGGGKDGFGGKNFDRNSGGSWISLWKREILLSTVCFI